MFCFGKLDQVCVPKLTRTGAIEPYINAQIICCFHCESTYEPQSCIPSLIVLGAV